MTTTDFERTDHTDTTTVPQLLRERYPHAELTERIIGCMFRVFNTLKFGHPERYYQRALAAELHDQSIDAQREVYAAVHYRSRIVGKYYFDFVVQDCVVVELKVAPEVYAKHLQQLLTYLRASGYKIGLILLITQQGIVVKRVIV